MNPRRNLEDVEPVTTRAYITLFREEGDKFAYAVDNEVDEDEKVQAFIVPEDYEFGTTVVGVNSINRGEPFKQLKEKVENMGLSIVEYEITEEYHEDIGDYTAYSFTATAKEDIEAEWNVPHLVVYGSLDPEIEEACQAAFGDEYNYTDIRNHFIVYGEGLTPGAKDIFRDEVRRSSGFFEDDRRHVMSNIETADYV